MIFVIQFYEIALNSTLLDDYVKNLDLKKDSLKYSSPRIQFGIVQIQFLQNKWGSSFLIDFR